jgi:GAF domain-containing protein
MHYYPVRADEEQRLELLRSLDLIGAPPRPELEAVVALACDICHTPSAVVSLVGEELVWHLAAVGPIEKHAPRADAFCNYTIQQADPLVIEDAAADPRFADSRFVRTPDGVRFYAGVPIVLEEGPPIGSLCVVDMTPRSLEDAQVKQLQNLARIVAGLFARHRDAMRVSRLSATVAEGNERLTAQSSELAVRSRMLQEACDLGEMGAFEHDLRTNRMRWSDYVRRLHDLDDEHIEPEASIRSA